MPRPKATVFSVWMLSSMWRVDKRRVKGFHMIPNEPGEASEALRESEKKGPECNRKQPLDQSSQQLFGHQHNREKNEVKEDIAPGQPAPTKLCFNENNSASKHVL